MAAWSTPKYDILRKMISWSMVSNALVSNALANGLSKESQGRNIKNTALGWHAGVQEHQMANLVLCLYD